MDKLEQAEIFIVKDKQQYTNLIKKEKTSDLESVYGRFTHNKPNITFVFCGQGPQFIKMGQDLMSEFKRATKEGAKERVRELKP